jgi:NAD(P)-dependent dehydrogenase (short-subunit alcohol dehydrogenase family)
MSMDDLMGKTAVVTGGASGIGLAMGHAFADQNMKVVLADIETDALDEAVAGFDDGAEVVGVLCDVSDGAQVEGLRDAALDHFGGVHLVCNNAGVSAGGPVWENSLADWNWVLGVNLMGVVHGIRAFTPLFIEQGEGHIVNTASMAGLTSPPFMAIYNVSKHAVVTLTETLFADLQLAGHTGVGASVLCPGWVRTRIHEAGRNRPEGQGGDVAIGLASEGMQEFINEVIASGLDPAVVADQVVNAVRGRQFYVLTHPAWNEAITRRTELIVEGSDPQIANLPT